MRHDPIRRRTVYYLAGFDPRPWQHYFNLHRDAVTAFAERTGIPVEISVPDVGTPLVTRWQVVVGFPSGPVETEFRILRWADLVRARFDHPGWTLRVRIANALIRVVKDGAFRRAMRLRRWMAVLASVPSLVLFGAPLLALALLSAIGVTVASFAPGWIGIAAVAAAAPAVLYFAWRGPELLDAIWMGLPLSFAIEIADESARDYDARKDAFVAIVEDERSCVPDELVMVGHSMGAETAVSVLARLLARTPRFCSDRRVALVTLGTLLPVVVQFPAAQRARHELVATGRAEGLFWVDASSPNDIFCVDAIDPFVVAGVDRPVQEPVRPSLVSIPLAFSTRVLDNHFLYLSGQQLPGGFDYVQMVCGPAPVEVFCAQTFRLARDGGADAGPEAGPPSLAR